MSGDLHIVRPIAASGPAADGAQVSSSAPLASAQPAPGPGGTGNHAIAVAYDQARLRILRSLERGEIDVAEAGRRLETLDHGDAEPPADLAGGTGGAGNA
jgi:hypothetical protein